MISKKMSIYQNERKNGNIYLLPLIYINTDFYAHELNFFFLCFRPFDSFIVNDIISVSASYANHAI